jgi:ABC-type uncharacterized transport system substrate-binding protein
MQRLGYVDGKTMLIEQRWANGYLDRRPGFADELVRLKVDVIVTASTPAVLAAKNATDTIPIVIASSGNPVKSRSDWQRDTNRLSGHRFFGH